MCVVCMYVWICIEMNTKKGAVSLLKHLSSSSSSSSSSFKDSSVLLNI